MLTHAHVTNAERALSAFDKARTGYELSRAAVRAASALRILLYEPAHGHQGDFIECREVCCR